MIPVEEIIEDWETKSKFYLSMLPVVWGAAASAWLRRADQLSAQAFSAYRQTCMAAMRAWMRADRQPIETAAGSPASKQHPTATAGQTQRVNRDTRRR